MPNRREFIKQTATVGVVAAASLPLMHAATAAPPGVSTVAKAGSASIDVQSVLRDLPHFETFCSVARLDGLVERLRADKRFVVEVAGKSRGGLPVHHVRFGRGAVKALLVAGPHPPETIGSLTVFAVMTLLQQGHRALTGAGVEWHIVPCIDPDSSRLNEGWTQQPFTPENFVRNFYLPTWLDQVDTSFPVTYKNLSMKNPPSQEGQVLQRVLDTVRPDFFFSLHNTFAGGAFYYATRDLGRQCYRQIHALREQQRMPLRAEPQWSDFLARFDDGIVENYTVTKHYDFLARTMEHPEKVLQAGGSSFDYLAQIKPEALTFVAEMGYFRHPSNESERDTGLNLRQFKLREEADGKFLATAMLEEWEKVKQDIDPANPFYRAVTGYVVPTQEKVFEGGMPITRYSTRDALFNPKYSRTMTEREKFEVCIVNDGLKLLAINFQFVRMLRAASQTPGVRSAIERMEAIFSAAIKDRTGHFDWSQIEVFECDRLVKVQLGSGLIALNAFLAGQGRPGAA